MGNKYLCCAEIIGLELPKETTLGINDDFLSNDPRFILTMQIKNIKTFISYFGEISAVRLGLGECFYFVEVENNGPISNHLLHARIENLLSELWRIRDNSIFVNTFFYLPLDGGNSFRMTLNYRVYNSKGNAENTKFEIEDIEQSLNNLDQLSNFITPKNIVTNGEIEKFNNMDMVLSHKLFEYNDSSRFERAKKFLFRARIESMLPLKIANYISFIECLFSTSGVEIQHQVSERVSIFINKYNNDLKKIETYNIIKSCYSIRSKYVHGAKLENKHKALIDLQEYSCKLDDVCRNIYNSILSEKLEIFKEEDKKLSEYFIDLLFS